MGPVLRRARRAASRLRRQCCGAVLSKLEAEAAGSPDRVWSFTSSGAKRSTTIDEASILNRGSLIARWYRGRGGEALSVVLRRASTGDQAGGQTLDGDRDRIQAARGQRSPAKRSSSSSEHAIDHRNNSLGRREAPRSRWSIPVADGGEDQSYPGDGIRGASVLGDKSSSKILPLYPKPPRTSRVNWQVSAYGYRGIRARVATSDRMGGRSSYE